MKSEPQSTYHFPNSSKVIITFCKEDWCNMVWCCVFTKEWLFLMVIFRLFYFLTISISGRTTFFFEVFSLSQVSKMGPCYLFISCFCFEFWHTSTIRGEKTLLKVSQYPRIKQTGLNLTRRIVCPWRKNLYCITLNSEN